MEEANDEENGKQANHDCAENTRGCATTSDELAQESDDSGDDDPDLYRPLAIGGIYWMS